MQAYWDASAALALIFDEAHSAHARLAQSQFSIATAWSWTRVEIEAGVARRDRTGSYRLHLDALLARIIWFDLNPANYSAAIALNYRHRLRAAGAGHLFCLRQAQKIDATLTLVCFDAELCAAARAEKLRVWSP